MICIHHPDPHFKKRHKKRRVVTDEFVNIVAKQTKQGCKIFLQSDIEDVCEDMSESFAAHGDFVPAAGYSYDCLHENSSPHLVQTEREIATINKGLNIYRMMYLKR